MIIAVPDETPVTVPDILPTVATETDEELQLPPVTPSVYKVELPAHTIEIPEIAEGAPVTVMTTDALQPEGSA